MILNCKLFHFFSTVPGIASWYVAYLFKAFPLDMSQYGRLFNSTRVPKKGKDKLRTQKRNRNVLVIRNGHIFLFEAIKKDGRYVFVAFIVIVLICNVIPTNFCLFKVSNRNTREKCKICSKLTIKIPERHQIGRKQVTAESLFVVFILLTLNR